LVLGALEAHLAAEADLQEQMVLKVFLIQLFLLAAAQAVEIIKLVQAVDQVDRAVLALAPVFLRKVIMVLCQILTHLIFLKVVAVVQVQ
jgi:hypothetical protein